MNEWQRLQRIADSAQLEAQSARRGIRNVFLFSIAFWTTIAAILVAVCR